MSGSLVVDIVLIAILVAYLVYGYRSGLLRSLSGILGVAVGGFLAVLLVPIVAAAVPDAAWRTPASFATVILLVAGGNTLGSFIGALLQRRLKRGVLKRADRMLGAVLTTIVAALVLSMVAASINALGVPGLSSAISSSSVLRSINAVTPDPVQAALAQLRSSTVDESLPRIAQALGAHTSSQDIPSMNTSTPALVKAGRSVVRITGNAYACGQSQSGTGFVVAKDRVVTNAHVVAGVRSPVVEVRGGAAIEAKVVYFDPTGDLAVLSVPGLPLASLPLTTTLSVGTKAVANGYPFGGPFVSLPAAVSQVGTITVDDIYGDPGKPREVYSLAADVEEGDSGGPLLTTSGKVAGVIFAKSAVTKNVGYAITMTGLKPVAAKAPSLSATVSPGRCTKD